MPDFFAGGAAQGAWFSGGEENDKKKNAFMAKYLGSGFTKSVNELLAVVEEGKKKYPTVESWALMVSAGVGKYAMPSVTQS